MRPRINTSTDFRWSSTWTRFLLAVILISVTVVPSPSLGFGGSSCHYEFIGRAHTVCKYPPTNCPGKKLILTRDATCQEKDLIVDAHNRLRQALGQGQIRGQPTAMNMRRLVWDDELAFVARRWAEQCHFGHDFLRDIGRFKVGQNVAATWTYDNEPPQGRGPEWKRHITSWFEEVYSVGFNPAHITNFVFNKPAGHYTQIAWAETHSVGCAYVYYKDPNPARGFTKLYVCNYGPRGNVLGLSMYRHNYGGRCTEDGLASRKYPGLCEIRGVDYSSMCGIDSENEIPVRDESPAPYISGAGFGGQVIHDNPKVIPFNANARPFNHVSVVPFNRNTALAPHRPPAVMTPPQQGGGRLLGAPRPIIVNADVDDTSNEVIVVEEPVILQHPRPVIQAALPPARTVLGTRRFNNRNPGHRGGFQRFRPTSPGVRTRPAPGPVRNRQHQRNPLVFNLNNLRRTLLNFFGIN